MRRAGSSAIKGSEKSRHRIDHAGSPKFIPTVRSLALSANSLYIRHEEKLIFVGVFHA